MQLLLNSVSWLGNSASGWSHGDRLTAYVTGADVSLLPAGTLIEATDAAGATVQFRVESLADAHANAGAQFMVTALATVPPSMQGSPLAARIVDTNVSHDSSLPSLSYSPFRAEVPTLAPSSLESPAAPSTGGPGALLVALGVGVLLLLAD